MIFLVLRPTKSQVSSVTGKLYIESHSSVSILVTAVIAAIIGHSNLLITQPSYERFHDHTMNGWIAIWLMFVAEHFLKKFGELEVTFPAKCKGPLMWLVSV